jgi:uncharacterized protein
MLAVMTESGEGIIRDKTAAFNWYLKAAQQGEPNSQVNIAQMYMEGRGTPQNNDLGLDWLLRAANSGFRDAETNMAILVMTGYALPQDFDKAMGWALKAARQHSFDQYFSLTYLYSKPEKDVSPEAAAFKQWLENAGEAGSVDAQFLLGYLAASDQGFPDKYSEAAQWLELAAKQDDQYAKLNLGLMFQKGFVQLESIEDEMAQAHQWYQQAAEAGLSEAQYYLGIQFFNGVGTEADPAKAYQWLSLAVENGNAEADESLKTIISEMTPEQITQGKELVGIWKARHTQ